MTGPVTFPEPVRLDTFPNALDGTRIEMEVPAGLTIAQMLAMAVPDEFARSHMIVFIGGHQIHKDCFHAIRPKPGVKVEAKMWVGDPGSLGALLSLGLSTIAPSVAGWLGVTGVLATNLITAAVTILGGLAINALVKPADMSFTSRPGIGGARNAARPYGAIPIILGRNRVTPDTAAEPYTERHGDDLYLRQVFVVGYGPLDISDIRIGDTPIGDFDDVDVEIREGYGTDNDMRLFPKVPYTNVLGIKLESADGWTQRTTEDDIDEIFLDFEWPQGLVNFSSQGDADSYTVVLNVQYRVVGSGTWIDDADIEATDNRARTIRRSRRIKVDNGQYEVRVRRETVENPNAQKRGISETVYWTAMRMMRSEDPIQLDKKLAKIAVRIKASNQLNGALDQLNCIATSVAQRWNGSSWDLGTTRSPAALLRMIAQGPMVKRPRPNGRLDLEALEDWAEHCADNEWNCDAVINSAMSQHELFSMIAATGRAAITRRDGKLSVAIDREITVPTQMFTPRNVMSFALQKVFPDLPDAMRVKFISAPADYKEDEIYVYNEGKNKANSVTFETLDMWGKTEPQEAAEFGRYWFWTAKLRPEVAEITTDIEGLVCAKGDMVRLAHDVMLTGLAQGRIVSRTLNGSGDVVAIRLDAHCPMDAGPTYGVRIRRASAPYEVTRAVTTVVGGAQDLTFASAIAAANAPAIGDLVAFGVQGAETSDWTVKSITPEDDLYARLVLVPHAPEIHTAAAGEIPDYDPVLTVPPEYRFPSAPVNVTVVSDESALELVGTALKARAIVAFDAVEGVTEPPIRRAIVQTRRNGSTEWNNDQVTITGMNSAIIRGVRAGAFIDIRVRFQGENDRMGAWTTITNHEVIGATTVPDDVTGFTATVVDGVIRLAWDLLDEVDIAGYRIKRQAFGVATNWATAVEVVPLCEALTVDVPMTLGTFLIKGVDRGGRESTNAAVVAVAGQDVPALPDIEGNLIPNGRFKYGDLRHWIDQPAWAAVLAKAGAVGAIATSSPGKYMVRFTRQTTDQRITIAELDTEDLDDMFIRYKAAYSSGLLSSADAFEIAYYDADDALITTDAPTLVVPSLISGSWNNWYNEFPSAPSDAARAVLTYVVPGDSFIAGEYAFLTHIKVFKRREAADRMRDNSLATKSVKAGAVVRRTRQFTSGATTLTTTAQTIETVTNSTDQDAANEDAKVEFSYEVSFTPDATPRRYLVTITLNGPGGFSRSYRFNNAPDATANASFQSGTLVWIVPGDNSLPDTFNVRAEVNINNGTVTIAKTQLVITSHKKPG